MITVTDVSIGLAMYLASAIASNIQFRTENDVKNGPSTVDEWIEFCRPQMGPEFEDMDDEHPIFLLDNEGELNPDGITPLMRILVMRAMEGKVKPILAMHDSLMHEFEDGNSWDHGAFVDRGFFMNFYEAMASAKNAFYHHSEWLTSAIDVDDDIKALLEKA